MIQGQVKSKLELLPTGSLVESEHTFWNDLRHEKLLPTSTAFSDDFELKGNVPFTDYTILPFTDWAYNGNLSSLNSQRMRITCPVWKGYQWGPWRGGGGSRFLMSILRNGNVALSNLRNAPVTLSILRNDHVPCHYLLKPLSHNYTSYRHRGVGRKF